MTSNEREKCAFPLKWLKEYLWKIFPKPYHEQVSERCARVLEIDVVRIAKADIDAL